MRPTNPFLLSLPLLVLLAGCQSAYYSTLEKLGIEKREILVDRVENARDAQEETREVFSSALEEFSALVNFQGGNLEDLYKRLSKRFEEAESTATKVNDRIGKIASVADALFREWEDELNQYTSDTFREQSRKQLQATKQRYGDLMQTMRRAEDTIPPVLNAFRDQVLFL